MASEKRPIWKGRSVEELTIILLALIISVYHIASALFGVKTPMQFRPFHLGFLLPIAFLRKAAPTDGKMVSTWRRIALWILAILAFASNAYIAFYAYERYSTRMYLIGSATTVDMVCGFILIILVLIATKLVIGWPLAVLAGISILYLRFGAYFPSGVGHVGYAWKRIIDMEYMGTYGVFGVPLGASASFIFLFMIFGAYLEASGTGSFLIDWATGLFGSQRGGPAKIAVVSSGLLGMISGSPTSNVVTTGVFTIPMMRKVGYDPAMAGAVEATASTGGQIMPPIMGAAAFILAEFTGTPYLKVAACAAVPAFLYYLSTIMQVHFYACRHNLGGLPKEELPNSKKVFRENWNQLIPIVLLVALMMMGFSTHYAAVWALFSIPLCGLLKKHTRMSPSTIFWATIDGAKQAVMVAVACAASGIVIGAFNMSGLAIRLTSAIVGLASSSLLLALMLTMLAALILGMGIPTTAAYITCVAVVAPALTKLGLEAFVAHMFVFYFAVVSSITPPVAIAAYAASGLTGADPIKIGFKACRLGIIAFLVPYMFAYQLALLLLDSWQVVIPAVLSAVLGTIILASGLEGWAIGQLCPYERIPLIAAGLCCIYPGTITDVLGVGIALAVLVPHYHREKRKKNAAET